MSDRRLALVRAGLMLAQLPIILIEASQGHVAATAFWVVFLIANGVGLHLWCAGQEG